MEPQIVDKPAFTLIGMKLRGQPGSPEIPQLWRAFDTRMGEIEQVINPAVCYGATDNFDMEKGLFDYLAAVEVGSGAAVPDGMVAWQVPAQTYAVFTSTLPTVGPTFDQIYGTWLPRSGYRRGPGPEFEFYGERFDPNDANAEFGIYIPIVKG